MCKYFKKTNNHENFFKFLFLIQTTICFSQTKEETISWLRETLDYHFNEIKEHDTKVDLEKDDDCGIICAIKKEKEYRENRALKLESIDDCEMKIWHGKTLMTIPLKGLLVKESFSLNPSKKFTFRQNQTEIKFERTSEGKRDVDYDSWTCVLINENINAGLSARVEKAIKHLATFCKEKKELF